MGVAAQACYFTTTQCATLPFRALRSVGERYALRDRFASCNADATLSDLICATQSPNEQHTNKKKCDRSHTNLSTINNQKGNVTHNNEPKELIRRLKTKQR